MRMGPMQVASEPETLAPPTFVPTGPIADAWATVRMEMRDPSRMLQWTVRTKPAGSVSFMLRTRYLILAPVFWMMRGAMRRDLRQLQSALEKAIPITP